MERLVAVAAPTQPLGTHQAPAVERPPLVWLVSCHGGAGTTFLSHAWAFAGDAQRAWPQGEDISPLTVLVARESTKGLDAAEQALREWHTDENTADNELLGVVLVAESAGKKIPREVEEWKKTVSGLTPRMWRVDWIPDWTVARASELEAWWPGDEVPVKRKKSQGTVPQTIAAVGSEVFTAAVAALTEKEEQ